MTDLAAHPAPMTLAEAGRIMREGGGPMKLSETVDRWIEDARAPAASQVARIRWHLQDAARRLGEGNVDLAVASLIDADALAATLEAPEDVAA